MQDLKIDITRLRTQSEYARENKMSRQRVSQLVRSKELQTVEIKGATLILVN